MIDKKTNLQMKLHRGNILRLVSIAALGLAAVFSYFFLDEHTISCLSHHNHHFQNGWLRSFEQLGKAWMLSWLSMCWILFKGRLKPAVIVLAALVIVAACIFPIKIAVQRPRPEDVIKLHSRAENRNPLIRSWSFPSGDTADIFATATVLARFSVWPLTVVFFAVSFGIGLLRIAVLAHYPSDICVGAAIGIFSGWLALQINRWVSPLNEQQLNRCRQIAALGVILIPISIGLLKGIDDLLIFLKTYGVLVMGIYLIAKTVTCLKKHL